jgi:hypothetical protein
MIMNTIPDNWYENFFAGINCEMWEKAATTEWTAAEVAFIMNVLNVPEGGNILDVRLIQAGILSNLLKKAFM